jgi:hypothetical protein
MTMLGGFLKQMNDSIEYNRRLLKKKMTVEKLRETYREEVLSRPLHYEHLNPEVLKDRIRKKLKRNKMQELIGRIVAVGLLILTIIGTIWVFLSLTAFASVVAQIPQDIPNQSDPVDFSDPLNIVLYIVLPVLMILVYILWRRSKKNR